MKTYGRPVLNARLFYDNGACSLTCLPTHILPLSTQTSQILCLSVNLSVCLPTCMSVFLSFKRKATDASNINYTFSNKHSGQLIRITLLKLGLLGKVMLAQ